MNKYRYLTNYKLIYIMILITPIVDTLNGIYILHYGPTGLSLGTFFRAMILFCISIKGIKNSEYFQVLLISLYFPVSAIAKGYLFGGMFRYITYSLKWIFPVLLIAYFVTCCKEKKVEEDLKKSIDFWAFFIPLSIIIEYVLGIGYVTYYGTGFKGLYYSTNDIAFVLIVLLIYKSYELLNGLSFIACLKVGTIAISILLVATKSSIIFMGITFIFFIICSKKISINNKVRVVAIMIVGCIFVGYLGKEQIGAIFERYGNMWSISDDGKIISQFIRFASSGRTDKIPTFFGKLVGDKEIMFKFLFGWIQPDNATVIEMDWIDLICQYGLLGFSILTGVYVKYIGKVALVSEPYGWSVIVGLIYSLMAGHVISGAFSGTCFSIATVIYIMEKRKRYGKK